MPGKRSRGEPEHAALAHEPGRGEHARRVGRRGVGGRRARADDAARGVAAQLRQRARDQRRRHRPRAGQPRRDPVVGVPQLGGGVLAVPALGPAQDERDHRVQERQRVGGLQQVGVRRPAVLVDAHERLDLARPAPGSAPLLAQPGARPGRRSGPGASGCTRRESQSRAESHVAGRVRERALDVVGHGGDPQRLGGARVELVDPLERAHEVARVRVDRPPPTPAPRRPAAVMRAPRSSRDAARTASAIFT